MNAERVFYYFEEISRIPRGSGNEREISNYLVKFAKDHNLEYIQDEVMNVIIKKKGFKGYENSPAVILQGHMDMVCEKNGDVEHNFEKDPIKLIKEGDFITADGTTLGADNGIAVAYCLALLEAEDISHPPIEAIITVDEEVGLLGASALDCTILKGKRLINIDSEEEGKILVSCAGGMRATIHLKLNYKAAPENKKAYEIKIKGLKGGHSGTDIDKERANANKLMGRVLSCINKNFDIDIVSINGGSKDNAIPREAQSVIFVEEEKAETLEKMLKELEKIYNNEYKNSDRDIIIQMDKTSADKVIDKDIAKKAIDILILIPNGVQGMSTDIEGLVETSTNIGIVATTDEEMNFASAVRSSVESKKEEVKNTIAHLAEIAGGTLTVKGEYPGWEYNSNSILRPIFEKTYFDLYGKKASVEAIHAGLECGLFAKKIDGVDMVSIGPEMYDVHTPDERLSISSTERTWDYLKEVLKRLK